MINIGIPTRTIRTICLFILLGLTSQVALSSDKYVKILQQNVPADGSGMAAIVVKENKTLFKGAQGMADIELNVPMQVDNVFRIGSITKQFTAAAIMLLQEDGKLSVDDSLSKYLPDFPTHGHTITLKQLLSHTSGLNNYTNNEETMTKRISQPTTLEEIITLSKSDPMIGAPGEQYAYSNTAYLLLGAIIEKVSEEDYATFVKKRIFDKLDMKQSYYGGLQIIPKRANPYSVEDGQTVNAQPINMTWPHAAGALLSTVEDLARWNTAFHTQKLLSKESYQLMTTPTTLNNGQEVPYGFGLGMRQIADQQSIGHNGGINGYLSASLYLPDHAVFVAVLSNNDKKPPAKVADLLAATAIGKSIPSFEPANVNQSEITPWLGNYKIDDTASRRFYQEKGKYFTHRTEGQPYEVIPMSTSSFYYPDSLTYFELEKTKDGVVMKMYSNLNSTPSTATRED